MLKCIKSRRKYSFQPTNDINWLRMSAEHLPKLKVHATDRRWKFLLTQFVHISERYTAFTGVVDTRLMNNACGFIFPWSMQIPSQLYIDRQKEPSDIRDRDNKPMQRLYLDRLHFPRRIIFLMSLLLHCLCRIDNWLCVSSVKKLMHRPRSLIIVCQIL